MDKDFSRQDTIKKFKNQKFKMEDIEKVNDYE